MVPATLIVGTAVVQEERMDYKDDSAYNARGEEEGEEEELEGPKDATY